MPTATVRADPYIFSVALLALRDGVDIIMLVSLS
jgi:hypothetical protein